MYSEIRSLDLQGRSIAFAYSRCRQQMRRTEVPEEGRIRPHSYLTSSASAGDRAAACTSFSLGYLSWRRCSLRYLLHGFRFDFLFVCTNLVSISPAMDLNPGEKAEINYC